MDSFTHEFKPTCRSYYYTLVHQPQILWIFPRKKLIHIRDAHGAAYIVCH